MFAFDKVLGRKLMGPAEGRASAAGSVFSESSVEQNEKREEDLAGITEKDKWGNGEYVVRIESLGEKGIWLSYRTESVKKDLSGEGQPFPDLDKLKEFLRTGNYDLQNRRQGQAVASEQDMDIPVPTTDEKDAKIIGIRNGQPLGPEEIERLADPIEKEDAFDIETGQVWRNSDGDAFVVSVESKEGASFLSVAFTDGERKGEEQSFTENSFVEFIDDGGFKLADSPSKAESEKMKEEEAQTGESAIEKGAEKINPLIRPTLALLDRVRAFAAEKEDKLMLVYLDESEVSLKSLADKQKLSNGNVGRVGEIHKKLSAYMDQESLDDAKIESAKLETVEIPAPKAAKKERGISDERRAEKDRKSLEVFKAAVETLKQETLEKIQVAKRFSVLRNIGIDTKRSVSGGTFYTRVFFDDTHPQIRDVAQKVLGVSLFEAKKYLNDANKDLRKAWDRKKSEFKTENPAKKIRKKDSGLEESETVSENDLIVGNIGAEKLERTYEEMERVAEDDGAYHTLFGAIATGIRTMKEAVPGIETKKDQYMDRIAEALTMNLEASFDAVATRLEWSDKEKKTFAENIIRKGIEKYLK